jgi:cytochrome c oxidase cbb3-type subunit III
VSRYSDAQLSEIISNGIAGTGMPGFRTLTSAQNRSLVRYLRVLQGNREIQALPGDPARGKELFFGKAECSSCHSISGLGGLLGPDLTAYRNNLPADTISQAITNATRIVPTGYKLAVAISRDGTSIKGVVRNEDNFSVQLLAEDGSFHFFRKSDLAGLEYASQPFMPTNYAERLSRRELDDIVSYLMKTGTAPEPPTTKSKDKDEE